MRNPKTPLWLIMLVALTGIDTKLWSAAIASDDEATLPGCGECAAFSFLRLHGVTVRLSDVSTFCRNREAFDPRRMSIRDVRDVIGEFGVSTRALIHRRPPSLAELPTPCILYFQPGRWPLARNQPSGHYLTLAEVTGDSARVFDWAPGALGPELKLQVSGLEAAWDGDVIVRDSAVWPLRKGWLGALCVLAGLYGLLWFGGIRRLSGRERGISIPEHGGIEATEFKGRGSVHRIVVGLVGVLSGCGHAPPEKSAPTLLLSAPVHRAGDVPSGRPLVVQFPFRVTSKEPVVIREIKRTCACMAVSTGLLGRKLEPGSDHTLELEAQVAGAGLRVEVLSTEIITEPPSPVPLVVSIIYRVQNPPRLSVDQLSMTASAGERVRGEFAITYRRREADPPAPLREAACDWGGFMVEALEATSRKLPSDQGDGTLVVDTTVLTLRSKGGYDDGEHRRSLRVAFERYPPQTISTIVTVRHPFRPELDRYFLGTMAPGVPWEFTIRWKRDPGPLELAAVEAAPNVRIQIAPDRIVAAGVSPVAAGRFSGELLVRFQPGHLPPIKIPYSGLVTESARTP